MKAGVELFHAWIDPSRLEKELPDSSVNAFGKPVITHNYGNPAVCLNSPAFQEYAVGLYSDLAANYDPDYIQTCLIPHVLPIRYLTQNLPPDPIEQALVAPKKGGCFCVHCMDAAKKSGFDLGEARKELLVLAKQEMQPIMDTGISAEAYPPKASRAETLAGFLPRVSEQPLPDDQHRCEVLQAGHRHPLESLMSAPTATTPASTCALSRSTWIPSGPMPSWNTRTI